MLSDIDTILEDRVEPYELEKWRMLYECEAKVGPPSVNAAFSYAHSLVRSHKSDVCEGILILEDLLHKEPDDLPKRDYLYFLAFANARLKEYDRALAYLEVLLAAEHYNQQAKKLKHTIEEKIKRDGLKGAAIFGGGLMLIGSILAVVLTAARR